MDKGTGTFFAQLKNLAAKIDKECEQYKHAISEQNEEFSAPQAIKDITDMKNDIKKLKAPLAAELDRQKKDVQNLNDITTATDSFLKNFVSTKVTEIEQYLLQYGYKPYGDLPCKEIKKEKEDSGESEENEDKETAEPTTPKVNKRPPDPNRTPRLEDAGISLGTLQYLNSLQKNKPSTNTTVPARQDPKWSDIPADFMHNGIICTPSLTKSINPDISYRYDLHSALASPVLLSAVKPHPDVEEKLSGQPGHLPFNTNQADSPASPEFRTPGIKHILSNTYSKEHGSKKPTDQHKRPLHVGLFQSDEKKEEVKSVIKQEFNVPDLTGRYDDGEPVEPELTYSLEALTDMTGMFMINPVKKCPSHAQPFSGRADLVSSNKENATPPEPEMLTDRISRVKIKQEVELEKDYVPQQKSTLDEMPPSPKLFGNYEFLKH